MFEFERFEDSMAPVGAVGQRETYELLRTHYSEATRFYHDKSHVSECLAQFQNYRQMAEHPEEIEVAIWFHDAIYDTRANNNEEKSAELAECCLLSAGVNQASVERIVGMILATKTHQVSTPDSALMVDVDLGVLGAPERVFEQYDRNIRKEYHWVPASAYVSGRAQVLRSFLEREVIYHTSPIRDRYEGQARTNLARKIAQLDAGDVS